MLQEKRFDNMLNTPYLKHINLNLSISSKLLFAICLTAFSCFIFATCKRKETLTDTKFWKYSDGFYMGDVISFKHQDIKVSKDTIYMKNIAIATVDKIENRIVDKVLYIKSCKTKKIGRYVSK